MAKTFVIGDIHGAHLALKQVLERSGFDKESDTLITLGDIADGWPYVYECVEILLTIKNRIDMIGNHDDWFKEWLLKGVHPANWAQGGRGTLLSYLRSVDKDGMIYDNIWTGLQHSLNPGDITVEHWKFFMHQNLYYHDIERNYFFCHAGWDRHNTVQKVREIAPEEFYWDRDLWKQARSAGPSVTLKTADNFKQIFIGHSAYKGEFRMEGGVWNLDTGAGWSGRLTLMDIDSKEFWQSDEVENLYPDETVRRK